MVDAPADFRAAGNEDHRDVQPAGPVFMSVEMALEIWKWRVPWTSPISTQIGSRNRLSAEHNVENTILASPICAHVN